MIDYSLSPYATGITDPYLAEEERKRKEREAIAARMESEAMANPIAPVAPEPIKETRTIDPVTGETKIKIEGNERDLSSANPNTPTLSTAKAPVDNMAYTRQQESGGNYNIGQHFAPNAAGQQRSTATGAYGITAPAYADIQKNNPYFQGRDLASLSPQDQDKAFQAYQGVLGKQLQAKGVEPTDANLRAAHFAGAGGLSNYLKGGPISPQAAAANGGEANYRKILEQRLAGGAAPSSGNAPVNRMLPQATPGEGVAVATGQGVLGTQSMRPVAPVNPTQPAAPEQSGLMPSNQGIKIPGLSLAPQTPTALPSTPNPTSIAIQKFQDNQDNLDSLMQMRNDTNLPEHIRKRSGDRAYELMNKDYKKNLAQAKYDEMVSNGDQLGLARAISGKPKDEEGSFLKMIALGFISPQLAGAEAIKLGLAPTKWEQTMYTDKDGKDVAVEIQKRADGKILGGTKSDGTKLTAEELNLAGGALGSKLNIVGGTFVNDKTGEVGRVVSDEKTGRTYVQTDKGRKPMEGFRPQSSTGTAIDQRNKLIQEMNIKTQGKAIEEAMAIQRDYNKLLVGQGLAPLQPSDTPLIAPQIATGQPVQGQAQQAPAGVASPVAPTVQGQPMVAQGQPVQAPVSPAQSQAQATTGAPRPTASQIAATAEQQKEEAQAAGKDIATIRAGYGKSVDDATRLVRQAGELITDKGFEVSVGFSAQPGFQYIPGSDRATWNAKHQEVIGQQFTEAIKALKGLGAMSDKEGDAAQAAISRLKNTDQNEASFKASVKELQSLIKRGVERNAEKLGKEKPDWDTLMKAGTTESSAGTTSSGNKYKKVQ